jgi:hypothetical protein
MRNYYEVTLASGGQGLFLKKLPLDPAKTFVKVTLIGPPRRGVGGYNVARHQ